MWQSPKPLHWNSLGLWSVEWLLRDFLTGGMFVVKKECNGGKKGERKSSRLYLFVSAFCGPNFRHSDVGLAGFHNVPHDPLTHPLHPRSFYGADAFRAPNPRTSTCCGRRAARFLASSRSKKVPSSDQLKKDHHLLQCCTSVPLGQGAIQARSKPKFACLILPSCPSCCLIPHLPSRTSPLLGCFKAARVLHSLLTARQPEHPLYFLLSTHAT